MPKTIPMFPDIPLPTDAEDTIYVLRGLGLDRDRKVKLKDVAQGIIKDSNLTINAWDESSVIEYIPSSVQPFGIVEGEAHKIRNSNIVGKGLQDMASSDSPLHFDESYVPCYCSNAVAHGNPYVQKIPMKVISEAGFKTVVFEEGVLEYTLLPTDRNLLLYLSDSVDTDAVHVHGPLHVGASVIIVADDGISFASIPPNTNNYIGKVIFDYYSPAKELKVARNSMSTAVWKGTYFNSANATPAIDHFVEFYQHGSWTETTTGVFIGLRFAGAPVDITTNPAEQWVAPIPMILKSLNLALRFIGTGVPTGGMVDVSVTALIMDAQENIIWGPFVYTGGVGNFGSEPQYSANIQWEIPTEVTLQAGQYLHISKMQYDWLQGAVTLPSVLAKVTAMFGPVPL